MAVKCFMLNVNGYYKFTIISILISSRTKEQKQKNALDAGQKFKLASFHSPSRFCAEKKKQDGGEIVVHTTSIKLLARVQVGVERKLSNHLTES